MSTRVASGRRMVWSISCGMFSRGVAGGEAAGVPFAARGSWPALVIFSFFTAELFLLHSLLPLDAGADFQPQRVEPDEAGGVVLVVGFGRVGFHGGDGRVVEAHRGFAASAHDVALVKLHAHGASDILL